MMSVSDFQNRTRFADLETRGIQNDIILAQKEFGINGEMTIPSRSSEIITFSFTLTSLD